jgi:3-isopropylmalate/(R)-2-methylmalate dehydratase small subunit
MNWIFGDNVNTDLITPGRYNITTDPKRLASIAFIEAKPEFHEQVRPGDFIVAGGNFGCGSSRETAAIALKACGVQAILARSFARIFYRNGMNLGLLLVATDTHGIDPEDALELDPRSGNLLNRSKGLRQQVTVPPMMLRFWEEGGILSYLHHYGLDHMASIIG